MRKEVHDFQRDLTYDAATGVLTILGAAIPSATTIVSAATWTAPTNLTATRALNANLATTLGSAWTAPTNLVASRTAYDANSTTIDELADKLGTLITDYKTLVGHIDTLADVLGTVISDLSTNTVPSLKV